MNKELVLISKERLINLLTSEENLSRLEMGGVDNWDWYGASLAGELDALPPFNEAISLIEKQVQETPEGTLFQG